MIRKRLLQYFAETFMIAGGGLQSPVRLFIGLLHDRFSFDGFTAISIADRSRASIPEQANLLKTEGIFFLEPRDANGWS